jgi:hypothetical protein
MSEETSPAVREGQAALDRARATADTHRTQCLAAIADGLPAAVEQLAKHVA